jgi:hypothetical protein
MRASRWNFQARLKIIRIWSEETHFELVVTSTLAPKSKNIFKNWHAGLWISQANVSFSHVCVSNFFETHACRFSVSNRHIISYCVYLKSYVTRDRLCLCDLYVKFGWEMGLIMAKSHTSVWDFYGFSIFAIISVNLQFKA